MEARSSAEYKFMVLLRAQFRPREPTGKPWRQFTDSSEKYSTCCKSGSRLNQDKNWGLTCASLSQIIRENVALDPSADTLEHDTVPTYPCQLSLEQLSLGFVPLASRQARDAALGANTSETLAAPGTLKMRELSETLEVNTADESSNQQAQNTQPSCVLCADVC